MANVKINKDELIELIGVQLKSVVDASPDIYKNVVLKVVSEQMFDQRDCKANEIYVAIKFLNATTNFGQALQPITINILSEHNGISFAYRLLLEYASQYNLLDVGHIKQTYTTPVVITNFNLMYTGFRSTILMSGSFLIIPRSNPIVSIVYEGEEIEFITVNDGFAIQLEPQSFYGTLGHTESTARSGTFTLQFSTYWFDNDICNKVLEIARKVESINNSFTFTITYKNGTEMILEMKLIDYSKVQNLGDSPVVSLSFTP